MEKLRGKHKFSNRATVGMMPVQLSGTMLNGDALFDMAVGEYCALDISLFIHSRPIRLCAIFQFSILFWVCLPKKKRGVGLAFLLAICEYVHSGNAPNAWAHNELGKVFSICHHKLSKILSWFYIRVYNFNHSTRNIELQNFISIYVIIQMFTLLFFALCCNKANNRSQ